MSDTVVMLRVDGGVDAITVPNLLGWNQQPPPKGLVHTLVSVVCNDSILVRHNQPPLHGVAVHVVWGGPLPVEVVAEVKSLAHCGDRITAALSNSALVIATVDGDSDGISLPRFGVNLQTGEHVECVAARLTGTSQ